MAHITLSIPDEIFVLMKAHPEIKWSEVARQSIIKKVQTVEGAVNGKNLFESLSPKTQTHAKELSTVSWKSFNDAMKKKEWNRTKSLTQTS